MIGIKLFFTLISTLLLSLMVEAIPDQGVPTELWAAFGLWVTLMVFIAACSIKIFTSIWIKNGYAGLNKVLEVHEVSKFIAHVLAITFVEVFIGLIATSFSGKYPHPIELYYLSISAAVGSEVYALSKHLVKPLSIVRDALKKKE